MQLITVKKVLPLTKSYKLLNSELVATRIKQAGVRLASMLDAVAEDIESEKER